MGLDRAVCCMVERHGAARMLVMSRDGPAMLMLTGGVKEQVKSKCRSETRRTA